MSSDDLLSVDDIPADQLPNGTATVLTIASPTHDETRTAIIDFHGFVRETGPGRNYFNRDEWEVVEDAD